MAETTVKVTVRNLESSKDSSSSLLLPVKKLFTPGPLTVSESVRGAGARKDFGSRDAEFIQIVRDVRRELVELASLSLSTHTAVLMQGSGTFSVESVLNSASNRSAKILILSCGAYGLRMADICQSASIPYQLIKFPENESIRITPEIVSLVSSSGGKSKSEIGGVAIVHSETTSGVINPIHEIGVNLKQLNPELIYIVDAMSSFGGTLTDYSSVDFLISSANKCIEGIPGFGFVIARKEELEKCKGNSTSLSLDLYGQWSGLESNGQFRFTPPTHAIIAFRQALNELEQEGGVQARFQRYKNNNQLIKSGMAKLGFQKLVHDQHDGHIITSFHFPTDPNFNFATFYAKLSEKGQLIYPGKVTNADCFRIGNIGHLFPEDMRHLVTCVEQVLVEMKVSIPVT